VKSEIQKFKGAKEVKEWWMCHSGSCVTLEVNALREQRNQRSHEFPLRPTEGESVACWLTESGLWTIGDSRLGGACYRFKVVKEIKGIKEVASFVCSCREGSSRFGREAKVAHRCDLDTVNRFAH